MDNWMAPVPGYEEVKEFHRKMGEKMGYLFASGMAQMSMMRPEMAAGIAQAAKEMAKLDGMPVQSIMKITGAGNGSMPDGQGQQPAAPTASDAASAAAQSQTSRLPGGLGSLASGLGGFGRRKQQQAPPTPSSQQPGTLIEITTELTSFSAGPVDESKFDVPAGFKQVEPELARQRAR
jgi:hypothetical protein